MVLQLLGSIWGSPELQWRNADWRKKFFSLRFLTLIKEKERFWLPIHGCLQRKMRFKDVRPLNHCGLGGKCRGLVKSGQVREEERKGMAAQGCLLMQ